jgi:DNA-binding NarL/FixJ family response regulator
MFVPTREEEDWLRPDPGDRGVRSSSSDERVTVLVVDDHDAFRQAMRDIVVATEGFALVGEAVSGEGALAAASTLSPKLMLVDQRMPGMGGVEAARRLAEDHPEVVVVLVSVEEPDVVVQRACGAAAFLRKHQLCPRVLQDVWRDHGSRDHGIETG